MGFAKYLEDNVEIMLERQFMKVNQDDKTAVKIVYSTNFLPLKNVVIEMKIEQQNPASICNDTKYTDKYIVCKDCGRKFLFSVQSQKYFKSRGWDAPKRCKKCRDYRNALYLMCSSF